MNVLISEYILVKFTEFIFSKFANILWEVVENNFEKKFNIILCQVTQKIKQGVCADWQQYYTV